MDLLLKVENNPIRTLQKIQDRLRDIPEGGCFLFCFVCISIKEGKEDDSMLDFLIKSSLLLCVFSSLHK